MISDLDQHPDGKEWDTDLCIIGGGAAGMALAMEFIGKPVRVLLLESGSWEHEANTQALYDSVITGLPFSGVHTGRFRVMGGSTTRWAGQSLPLDPLDFESRPWVAHSGWPIRFEALRPFYDRANRFMLVDTLNYHSDLFKLLRVTPPDFEPEKLVYHFSKWSLQPDLRRVYRRDLERAENIHTLLHANVTDLILRAGGDHLEFATIASLQGGRGVVRARDFVLCVGGVETARLLLACRTQRTYGLGNENDLVGRYFQDHPATQLGVIESEKPDQIQEVFNLFHRGQRKYSIRFSLAQAFQRQHRLLNASASIMFDPGVDTAYEILRQTYHRVRTRQFNREFVYAAAKCLSKWREIARPLWTLLVRRRTYVPDATFNLSLMMEQEPCAESRVKLSEQRDALGMPRSEIHWRLTEATLRTAQAFARLADEQFRRAVLGQVRFANWVSNAENDWRLHFTDQNHHIGTARMSDSPTSGVVNTNCRLHSVKNLYVASCAVFPTGGHSNPTLTMLALTKRLADHLKQIRF